MLKLRLDPDTFTLKIDENDSGRWIQTQSVDPDSFRGFGGENMISVFTSPMQNGSVDIVVVHNSIDSPIQIAQSTVQNAIHSNDAVTNEVNKLIEQIFHD